MNGTYINGEEIFELTEETNPADIPEWVKTSIQSLAKPAFVSLTPRQFRQALNRTQLRQQVEAAIAQADQDAKDWYEFATSFESNHPVVLQMAQAIGKSEADVKALFELGQTL